MMIMLKSKTKNKVLLLLSAVCLLAFLFSANVFNVKASAVHATVGINYSFDYSE